MEEERDAGSSSHDTTDTSDGLSGSGEVRSVSSARMSRYVAFFSHSNSALDRIQLCFLQDSPKAHRGAENPFFRLSAAVETSSRHRR
jgi:hypothetical protein